MSGMIMSGRRRIVAAVGGVAVLVVVAVGALVGLRGNDSTDGAEPVVTPTTSAPVVTPTPTPTPTIAAPELPDAAKKRNQKGAEAFFRYFIDVYNYSYATLDPSSVEAVSVRGCEYCAAVARDLRASREKGLRFEDGVVSVAGTIVAPDQSASKVLMVAFIDQTPGTVYRADGSVEESSDALKDQRADVTVRWLEGEWRMQSVVVGGVK